MLVYKNIDSNKRIEWSLKFDVDLVSDVKYEDDGVYSMRYGERAIGGYSDLPIHPLSIRLFVQTTWSNVYVVCGIEFKDDEDYEKYKEYTDGSPYLQLDMELSKDEITKLLLAIIKNTQE